MKAKLRTKEMPQVTQARLTYGKGTMNLRTNGEPAAVQIFYTGKIKGINKLGDGWTQRIGRNVIIIFSFAQRKFESEFLHYIGEIEIIECKVVSWNQTSILSKVVNLDRITWNSDVSDFNFDARKYEEIEKKDKTSRIIKKSSI